MCLYFYASSPSLRLRTDLTRVLDQQPRPEETHEPLETLEILEALETQEAVATVTQAPERRPPHRPDGQKVNATFVTLARNADVWDIARSIRQVEDRFNRRFNYDWVFLNDQPFDDTFRKITTSLVSGKTKYGLVPKEHWSFPQWVDQKKAAKAREQMGAKNIIYGDSISYRHMCRYESGFFFRHPLMMEYDWYWRVEPGIELYCDVTEDPFRFMEDNDKTYGFVLSLYEYENTIPTLWKTVKDFIEAHPQHIAENNTMAFISDDKGETYNLCHFVCRSLSLLCLM